MNTKIKTLALLVGLASAACGSAERAPSAHGQSALTAPGLRTVASFAVLGGATVTNTGPTTIAGDLGVSPGSAVTGFPPGLQTSGAMHKADAVALQAQKDLTSAYLELAGQPCTADLTDTDLGGRTLLEGVYCFSSAAQLTGALVLDAQGNAGAVFIFKVGSTLITASNASVSMINGGNRCNVFWQVSSSATIATDTTFLGSILALTSISLKSGASVEGRALARNGEVTMDDNHVALATCTTAGTDAGATPDVGGATTDTGGAASDAGVPPDTGNVKDTAPPAETAPPCNEEEGDCY